MRWKDVEDDPYMIAAEARELVFAVEGEVFARADDASRARPFETGQHHEKRGLAGTGRPHETGGFTLRDGKVDPPENIDRTGRTRQAEFHAVEFDDCVGQTL